MAKTLSIRPATLADTTPVDALLSRSYPALLKESYPPSTLVTAVPLISRAQPRLLASGTYFVVTDDESIVGAGGWSKAAPGKNFVGQPGVGNIRHVVTDHRHVRKGIGRLLMETVFETAKASGVVQLECYSTFMAQPFYTACGFRTVRPITIHLRPGIELPAVHMRRFI